MSVVGSCLFSAVRTGVMFFTLFVMTKKAARSGKTSMFMQRGNGRYVRGEVFINEPRYCIWRRSFPPSCSVHKCD